ncbi:MAG: hypothetical protein PHV97_00155 [Candidatus Omnitrophica bacterium]|nr:hypothetical protein [Candidatus Omnitrophota bacterium]
MNKNTLFFIFLSVLASLNLGSVRKSEDPIRDTQTNPILYEQKMEEEKDGKKGPLMYHVKNNPRESFFIDPPFQKEKKSSPQVNVTEKVPASEDASGWWEEPATAPQALPSAERISEPLPEPFPEAEQAQNPEPIEQSASAPENQDASSGKGDDFWW